MIWARGHKSDWDFFASEAVVSRLMWKIGRRSSGIRLIVASGAR
jgi:hypothetical protein